MKSPIYSRLATAATAGSKANFTVLVSRYASDAHQVVSSHRTFKAAIRALASVCASNGRNGATPAQRAVCGAYIRHVDGALYSLVEARKAIEVQS